MKPEDRENDSNKKSDKNVSNFNNNQKRSSKFDSLLNGGNRPNNPGSGNSFSSLPPKEKAKKIWKWVSIVIYLFLAGLGITGFIQSCVLRTTSTVGAGIELYNSKNEVAPYVSTFKVVEKTRKIPAYDDKGNLKLDENGNVIYEDQKYYVLEPRTKENYLTSKDTIKELQTQLENIDGYGEDVKNLYGKYDNYSSALRIISLDGQELDNANSDIKTGDANSSGLLKGNNGGNFIFMNNKILDYLNANSIQYKTQNTWENINLFVVKRPDNWDSLTNSQKDYYGMGLTDISNSFVTWEKIGNSYSKIETIDGKYYTKDVNGDGIIDSSTLVEITDQERISKFEFSLDAEVATLNKDDQNLLNSEAFARDYLMSLMSVQFRFGQYRDLYNEISKQNITNENYNPTALEVFSTFSKTNFESLISSNKKFSLQVKNAILIYQNEISSVMEQIGFGTRRQVYSDEGSNYYETTKQPFRIVFLPDRNDKGGIVLGTGSAPQKPITSWGEAWELGPFYGLVVWPLSYIINGMMGGMPTMYGWAGIIAIVIAILLTRVIVTLFTYKSLFASHKQQQLNPKKAKIDAKYEPFKGNREMEQRKRQELAKLYKANNVSMMAPLKAMCISMPIFFAVWRVVQGIPDIKATTWLGIQFSLTSWRELFAGEWQYLPLLLLAAGIQAISQLLPRILNKRRMKERANKAEIAALKKANKTQNIMMIVFIVMSVLFEAGVQIYWIVGGLWQIGQVLAVHHIVKSEWYRTKGYKYV